VRVPLLVSDGVPLELGVFARGPLVLGMFVGVTLELGEAVRLADREPLPDGLELRVPLWLRVAAPLRDGVTD
jgi:hypothetical protein